MSDLIWKPYSQGGLNPGGASFLLPNGNYKGVDILDANGNVVKSLARGGVEGSTLKYYSREGGGAFGTNLKIRVTGADGSTKMFNIPNGGLRYEGTYGGDENLVQVNKGIQSAGSGTYAPGTNGYGAFPADLTSLFPSATTINYNNIEAAPYNFTDVMDYAKQFGDFSRSEYQKNFDASKQYALDSLQTELQGLAGYVPAAAAIKRSQTGIDNVFNQSQRTAMLDAATPGMRQSLAAQQDRANTYAQGRLPDSVQDRSLELGVRSQSADISSAGGFGANSSVARKASDLMSADKRLQIAQMGEGLVTQNANTRNAIEVATSEYSNAGSQVSVTPSVSASQLQAQYANTLTNYAMIPASTALQSTISQEQFRTNLEQTTRQFNSTNQLNTDQFNANALNDFALQKFQYQVGYAGALAGAAQTNINTQVGLDQQASYLEQLKNSINDAQTSGNWSALGNILGSLFGVATASAITDYLKKKKGNGASGTTGSSTTGSNGSSTTNGNNSTVDTPSDTDTSREDFTLTPEEEANVADGYNPDGSEIQTASLRTAVTPSASFTSNYTGYTISSDEDKASHALVQQALNIAGITTQALPGYVHISTDEEGNKYYTNPKMANNEDSSSIVTAMQSMYNQLLPLKVFTNSDSTKFKKMIGNLTSQELFQKLDAAKASNDKGAFIDALTEAFA